MDCPLCNNPMDATTGYLGRARRVRANLVTLWVCKPCDVQLDRKPDALQKKLPGLEPGRQEVRVQEERRRCRRQEHRMQSDFFTKLSEHSGEYPILKGFFAIPNGGYRPIRTGIEMKEEGVKAGVPDICLPVARRGYNALYLEMKVPGKEPTPKQIQWHRFLRQNGNLVSVCKSSEEALDLAFWYLELKVLQGSAAPLSLSTRQDLRPARS